MAALQPEINYLTMNKEVILFTFDKEEYLKKCVELDNFDYYSDLVFEKKEIIQINLENGSTIYLKPVNENETR